MEKEISAFSFYLFGGQVRRQTHEGGLKLRLTMARATAALSQPCVASRRVASCRVRITLLRCCVGIVDLLEASCTKFANTGIDYHIVNRIRLKQFTS